MQIALPPTRPTMPRPQDFADSFGAWQHRSNACYDESRTVVVKVVDRWGCS